MFRLVVLLAAGAALASALEFNCETMVPLGRKESEREKDNPFIMVIDTSKLYRPGDSVTDERIIRFTVKVKSTGQHFNQFALQARQPLVDKALGEFRLDDNDIVSKLARCERGGDTVTNKGYQAKQEFTATWVVPSGLKDVANIEFDVVVVSERRFWIFNTQMISLDNQNEAPHHPTPEEEREKASDPAPSDDVDDVTPKPTENTGTGEDPNEPERRQEQERQEAERHDHVKPLHDATDEQELSLQLEEKLRKQIEEEDKYSEGDWQKEEEEENRKHQEEMHKEEIEYEEMQAREERARRERIQFEIKDKEEHDRKKEHKIEKPAGGKVEGEIDLGEEELITDEDQAGTATKTITSLSSLLLVILALWL